MKHAFACVAGLCAGLLGSGSARAAVIYLQPSDSPGGTLNASQNDTSPAGFGAFARSYDNFTLGVDSLVQDVHWQGGYYNGSQAPIGSFTLQFWSDVAGDPGAPIYGVTLPGDAGETLAGSQFSGIYDYSVVLPVPFQAAGGTTYWLSIVPELAFPPQWGWHTGIGGDGASVTDFFASHVLDQTDLAFSLTGQPVPEPATLLLMVGPGAIALRRARRRRG